MKSEKQIEIYIEQIKKSLSKNKPYTRIAEEVGLDRRKISEIARKELGHDLVRLRDKRELAVALMIIDERGSTYIGKKLGLSKQSVNGIKNNIIWEKYSEYNKLKLKL